MSWRKRPTPCSRWTTRSPSTKFAEIDLRAISGKLVAPLETPPPVRRSSPEQLRGRKNHEPAGRKRKTAGQRSFRELDLIEGAIRVRHDLAEALDFSFGLEVDYDLRAARFPVLETSGELRMFRVSDHEIAGSEVTHFGVVKRTGIIFLQQGRVLCDPAFGNPDFRLPVFLRLDRNSKVIFRDVIANVAFVFLARAEENFRRLQVPERRLRIDVELAERFDFIIEELRADGELRLPGIEIENPAANGEVAARRDLRDAFVARFLQRLEERLHCDPAVAFYAENGGIQHRSFRRRLVQRCTGCDNEMGS